MRQRSVTASAAGHQRLTKVQAPHCRRGKPQAASLSRRLASSLIDIAAGLAILAMMMGAALAVGLLRHRRSSDGEGPSSPPPGGGLLRALVAGEAPTTQAPPSRPSSQDLAARLQSRPGKLGLQLASIVLTLRATERRSPGYRFLGLRLVDARDGGELSRRQQVVRSALRLTWRAANKRLVPVPSPPPTPENERLQAEIESARRRHQGNQEALQHALMRIYRENRSEPIQVSCLPLLARLPLIAALETPMPWSPLKQSLLDRLSGTVVIVDRGAR